MKNPNLWAQSQDSRIEIPNRRRIHFDRVCKDAERWKWFLNMMNWGKSPFSYLLHFNKNRKMHKPPYPDPDLMNSSQSLSHTFSLTFFLTLLFFLSNSPSLPLSSLLSLSFSLLTIFHSLYFTFSSFPLLLITLTLFLVLCLFFDSYFLSFFPNSNISFSLSLSNSPSLFSHFYS